MPNDDDNAAAEDSGPEYEVDFEAPPAPAPGEAASPATRATEQTSLPPAAPQPAQTTPDAAAIWAERLSSQERELATLRAQVAERQQQQRAQSPVDPARIDSGDATPQELRAYIEWLHQSGLDRLSQTAELAARRASSEQHARGLLNESVMGAGRDFDSFRTRYVEPIYRTNPNVRELLAAAVPQNPAMGEYYLGFLNYVSDRFDGDLVKGFQVLLKAIDNGVDGGRARGAQELTDKIQAAAQRGAQRVVSGQRGDRSTRVRVDSEALWNMSDEEFARFAARNGGGVI